MPDHVHILLEQHRTANLSEIVQKVKANSTRWAKAHSHGDRFFAWQRGYGFFGVGSAQFGAIENYIAKQKEHHQALGFQDEMRRVYSRLGIGFDERYLWD